MTSVLAQGVPTSLGTGPIALVIVLLMLIATAFLIRNMNGRIKRLPREFPDQEQERKQPHEKD